MRRLFWIVALVGAIVYPVSAKADRHAAGVAAAPVAVSLHGSIVLFAADGSGRIDVTRSGQDHAPVVAPNGRAVAFWRGRFPPYLATAPWVMVARPGADGRWRATRFSARPTDTARAEHTIAWAPGSHALAWFDGLTVRYRRFGKAQRTVLRLPYRNCVYPCAADIAISRDGGTIAAAEPPTGTGLPQTLRVAVRRLTAPRQQTITIHFRPGVLIGPNGRGSIPIGEDLSYTTSQFAPRGHTLQFSTIAIGAGRQMTGVFLVPDTGGRARLVQGNGHGLHGIGPFGYGMNGATHFEDAPNGRYTATDPTGGFYVAGEIGPLHVSVPTARGCVLAQWTWLADSTHIAYVTECTVPGSSPLRLRFTLGDVSIFGGAPIVLYQTETADPNAIELAPAYRCVACG